MNLQPTSAVACRQLVSVVECGSCSHLHLASSTNDCRDNSSRLTPEQLDAHYGGNGWMVVDE